MMKSIRLGMVLVALCASSSAMAGSKVNTIQDGEDFRATIDQVGVKGGASADAEVTQNTGHSGWTIISQSTDGSTPGPTRDGYTLIASVEQHGSDGLVEVSQVGRDGPRSLRTSVTQYGDEHEAHVQQVGAVQAASVTQFGEKNRGYVYQGVVSTGALQDGNIALLTQGGSDNIALATQYSGDNTAIEYQLGRGNVANIVQDDPFTVEGRGQGLFSGRNAGGIQQEGDSGQATVTQHGRNGQATIFQEAKSLAEMASITQSGQGDQAFIDQFGHNDTATISQLADGATAAVMQSGMGNMVTITQ